jgi:hypothetical protein
MLRTVIESKDGFYQSAKKFYTDEVNATLVEIIFYFQALSMEKAPRLLNKEMRMKSP